MSHAQDDIAVRSLRGTSMDVLSQASNEAFGDYAVDVRMTPVEMETLCRQNSVSLEDSAGIFDGDRLVGFWLNGIRTMDGVTWGYDAGTAICKPYRGRGLLSRLSEQTDAMVQRRGVREYVLEVLQENKQAFTIYQRLGFEVRRELRCLEFTGGPVVASPAPPGLEVEESRLDPGLLPQLPPMEYTPSWQHADASMVGIREKVHTVLVRREGRVVGCGMAIVERPRITQLRFDEAGWDSEAPILVVERLCRALERRPIVVGNVDPDAHRTLALLERSGFKAFVDQYEMGRSVRPSSTQD